MKSRVLTLLSIFVLSGCTATPIMPTAFDYPLKSLRSLCQQNDIPFEWDSVSQVITLTRENLQASTLVGSDVVLIGGRPVYLSKPISRQNNVILVPADFESKVLSRFRQEKRAPIQRFRKVVIDAGHGGKDPGATSVNGLKEKDVVLDISKRLKRTLERRGINVVMTRTRDEFVSLERRTEIATQSKADLFVSIHANSNPSRGVHGIEVYANRDHIPSDLTMDPLKNNHRTLFRKLSMNRADQTIQGIVEDMLESYKLLESKKLAEHVADSTSALMGLNNLGMKKSAFFVLRNNVIPSILIEMGYLTNPREEKLFQSDSFRQDMANSISQSILGYK